MALLKISALVTYVFTHVSFFISLPYLRFSVSDLMQMNVKESLTLTSKESLFTIAKFLHLFTWNGFLTNFVRILKRCTSISGTAAAMHRIKGLICNNYRLVFLKLG